VKLSCAFLCALSFLAAQSTSTVYQRDVNGRRTALRSSSQDAKGGRTELFRSVNGRQVPLEQSSETVLREGPGAKVTERIVRKFDREGRPALTERVVIEETPSPGGGSVVKETVFRSTLNGAMQEAERRTRETRVQGQTETTDVTIERPSPSSGFETVERRRIVATGPAENRQSTETVQRPDGNGAFRDMIREVTTTRQAGASTVTETATYELDMNRRLSLARQRSTSTTVRDGVQVTETSLYAAAIPGRTQYSGAPLQLFEQEVIESRPAQDGSLVETMSVRRPTLADPNRLGPPQLLFETVCAGQCRTDAASVRERAAAAAQPADTGGKQKDSSKASKQVQKQDAKAGPRGTK
jgi:hypothetical protein